jgi:anti-sigma B factor antagonist
MEDYIHARGPMCRIESERQGPTALIRLIGEFDLSCEQPFEEKLAHALDVFTSQLVVDLCELSFIDSVGLRMLLSLENRSRAEDFAFVVLCGEGQVREVLKLSGLDGLLPLVDPSGIVPSSDSPV